MKYFSVFTGIGGFDLPLREMGFECIGWSEVDKWAIKTFEVNFPELAGKNCGDITAINCNSLPDFNLLVGGSPCQDFSISKNNRTGLKRKRSGLFEEYLRIFKEKQPDNFIWENVKGVLSCNQGEDWKYIYTSFQEAGYKIKYKILDSRNYEVPQKRRRVFVIGQRFDIVPFLFEFPNRKRRLKDLFLQDILESGYTKDKLSWCIKANYYTYKPTFEDYIKREKQIKYNKIGEVEELTILECFRLQGFPDIFCHRAKAIGISNTQLYRQAGNAVTANVVRAILESLYLDNAEEKQLSLF